MQPPQNPYNQPNYGQDPYGAPPRAAVSLDIIGQAWQSMSANLGVWIGASAIYLGIALVVNLLQRATQGTGPNGMPQPTAISFVISIASIFVTQLLLGGMMRMALSSVRTGRTDLSLMFSAGNVLLPLVGAAIITGLAVGLGMILCIAPGVIAAIGLSLATPIIVDGRAGAIGALGESWNAMKPNLGSGFVLFLILGLIFIASAIPLGLGLLVTIPLLQVSLATIYRNIFDAGNIPPQGTAYTPPPIANPNF